jgi:copper(I)-binding protein
MLGHFASAQEVKAANISITGAYARATVTGQSAGAGFMKISTQGVADQLISASSGVASQVQMHSMSMEGNTMKMRQIDAIDIPANSSVELSPGGLHLMLIGLKAPLKEGDMVKIKLKFAQAGETELSVPVQALSGHNMHNH